MNVQPTVGSTYLDQARSVLADEAKKKPGVIGMIKNIAWTVTLIGPIMSYFRPKRAESDILYDKVIKELKESLSSQGIHSISRQLSNLVMSLETREGSLEMARTEGIETLKEVAQQIKDKYDIDVSIDDKLNNNIDSSQILLNNLVSKLEFILKIDQSSLDQLENLGKTRSSLTYTEENQLNMMKKYLNKTEEQKSDLNQKISFLKSLRSTLENTQKGLDQSNKIKGMLESYEAAKAKENLPSLAEAALKTSEFKEELRGRVLSSIQTIWNRTMHKKLESTDISALNQILHEKVEAREAHASVIWNRIEEAFSKLEEMSESFELVLKRRIQNFQIERDHPEKTMSGLRLLLKGLPPDAKESEAVKELEGLRKTTKEFFAREQSLLEAEQLLEVFIDEVNQAEDKEKAAREAFEKAYALAQNSTNFSDSSP